MIGPARAFPFFLLALFHFGHLRLRHKGLEHVLFMYTFWREGGREKERHREKESYKWENERDRERERKRPN